MGYLFQAVPPDLLNAEPPRLSPTEPESRREQRLASVFLSTLLAVPPFRRRVLSAAGLSGGGGRAQVFQNVRFRDEPAATSRVDPPDGLVRMKGLSRASAMFDIVTGAFDVSNARDVERIAEHLQLARERKIARVITLSSTVPDQAFLAAVAEKNDHPGPDRLRSLTWMDTVDIALHLLERKLIDGQVGRFLLGQYVRCLRDEVVREAQARAERGAGALFFTSLGADWDSFIEDTAKRGSVDPKDPRLAAIATNWLAFLRSLSLYLTRSAGREEDILMFPNVRARNSQMRRDLVMRRLKSKGQLLATFHKHGDRMPTIMRVDVARKEVVFQMQVNGPTDKSGKDGVADLAQAMGEDLTLGKTRIKIFWPSEKTPRTVTRMQAIKEPVAVAPPEHGMLPDKFIVERTVPCERIMAQPDSFVQLIALELRGFRASMRHLLHHGTAA